MRRNLAFLITAIVALMVLSGCSFRPQIPTTNTQFRADIKDINLSKNWWEDFGDERLNLAIENALKNNSDLALALNNIEIARVNLGLSRLEFAPNLSASGGATRANNLPKAPNLNDDSSYQAGLNLSFELDLWGRIRNAVRAKRASYEASIYDAQIARLSVATNTAIAYFTLASLEEQRQILADSVATYERTLALRAKQLKAGEIDALTYDQANSALILAKSQLLSAQDSYEKAQTALHLLCGSGYDQILHTKFVAHKLAKIPELPSGVPSTYLLMRPDVALAAQNLLASNALVGSARANYFPKISLTSSGGYASMDFDRLMISSASTWSLAGSFAMPFIDFGRTKSAVEIANLNQNASFIAYDKALKNAFADVANALNSRKFALEKARNLDELLSNAHSQFNLAQKRFSAGYASHLDFLDAQRNLLSAKLSKSSGDLEIAKALIGVYSAFGGGFRVGENGEILGVKGGDIQNLLDARKFHAPTKSASPFADL
jgi:efflux transporter, outer membrane factor lipoprotein, NodT family